MKLVGIFSLNPFRVNIKYVFKIFDPTARYFPKTCLVFSVDLTDGDLRGDDPKTKDYGKFPSQAN